MPKTPADDSRQFPPNVLTPAKTLPPSRARGKYKYFLAGVYGRQDSRHSLCLTAENGGSLRLLRTVADSHADCTAFSTKHSNGQRLLVCVDCDEEVGPVPRCAAQPCKQYARILHGEALCYGHQRYWRHR